MIPDKDKCWKCHGEKVTRREKILTVTVESGMLPGEKIRLHGEANYEPDCPEIGDIIIVLIAKESTKEGEDDEEEEEKEGSRENGFHRTKSGMDLLMEKQISLKEALLGFSFRFHHLDDRVVIITSPAPSGIGHRIFSHGDIIVIKGEGMPKRQVMS